MYIRGPVYLNKVCRSRVLYSHALIQLTNYFSAGGFTVPTFRPVT